jgi:thiamine biosynthesis lipoprotein
LVTVVLGAEEDEERARAAVALAFAEADRIEQTYSRFLEGNELSRLNARVGQWTAVSEEFYKLIEFGERVKQKTGGAFDLTVKTILEGWGYDANYSLKESVPGHTGRIDLLEGKVRLRAAMELGGLGKGYAIDRMDSFLQDFENVCINAGGDLRVRGDDSELRRGWRIVFEHPTDITKGIGFVDASDLALACSSPSRRSWRDKHHLVDARNGQPASDMLAVYTQSSAALLADAYSTALFVMGYEKAKALLGADGSLCGLVEAMLIGPDGKIFLSAGFQGELFEK